MPVIDAFLRSGLAAACLEPDALAKEIYIARRKDGQVGSGTVDDPYDGSTALAFDAVMRNVAPEGATIWLGPGEFPTQGGVGWNPKTGQRIVGSGIHATTIKLTITSPDRGQAFYAVMQEVDFLASYEISDLTIDCNLAGQPNTSGPSGSDGYPRIAVAAINLHGSNIVVRRVRVIHFGTNTPTYEFDVASPASRECFAITVGFAQSGDDPKPHNCIVEDCIVERPAVRNARETTCINLSAGEDPVTHKPAYHEDCVVRNCLVNCEYIKTPSERRPLLVKSLQLTAYRTATLETYEDHGYGDAGDEWAVVSGATDPGGSATDKLGLTARYNGSFLVRKISARQLSYTMDENPTSTTAGGEIWLGKAPSLQVAFADVSKALVGGNWEVTVTTGSPHFLFPNDYVLIAGVKVAGSSDLANRFNGYFEVTAVAKSRQFKYLTNGQDSEGSLDAGAATVGAPFQGVSGDGGYRAVIEGNRFLDCLRGGPFHDSFSSRSLIVRRNYYRNVFNGVYEFLGTTDENAFPNLSPLQGSVAAHSPGPAYRFTKSDGDMSLYSSWQVAKLTKSPAGYVVMQDVSQANGTFDFDFPGGTPASSNAAELVVGAMGGEITLESGSLYKFTRKDVTNVMPMEVGDLVILLAGASVRYVTVETVGTTANPVSAYFTFEASSAPPTPSAALRMFRVDNLVVEDNVFEMAFNMVERHNQSPPCAINITSRNPINGPWVYGNVIVRGNLIRHINGAVDPYYLADSRGVDVSSCRSLIVEANVIGLESANSAVRGYACGTVKPLNNLNFAGQPLAAFRWDLNLHVGELRTAAEDLFTLALR